jgi:hypothetical protein
MSKRMLGGLAVAAMTTMGASSCGSTSGPANQASPSLAAASNTAAPYTYPPTVLPTPAPTSAAQVIGQPVITTAGDTCHRGRI